MTTTTAVAGWDPQVAASATSASRGAASGQPSSRRRALIPLPHPAAAGRACVRRCGASARGGGGARPWSAGSGGAGAAPRRPAAIFPARRCRASSRLRDWPRASWATAVTVAPARSSRRSRWRLVERREAVDVEDGFDPRGGDVGVLAAGPGGAAGAQLDLRQRDRQALVDPQLLGHGYPASSGMWRSRWLGDRLPHPALGLGVGHPVAAEQHLLVGQRQPGDLPAHREALEQRLRAPPPGVLQRGRVARRRLADLGDRARR